MNSRDLFLGRYELVLTEDGSPTFQDRSSETGETMHHRGGAYAETQLIYGAPLRVCLDTGKRAVFSLGLGLGYNEILMAYECLKRNISANEISFVSFESEALLREAFLDWIKNQTANRNANSVYDQILYFFQADGPLVRQWLEEAIQTGTWQIKEALSERTLEDFTFKANCIFYDAFSSKTSPQLWSEQFLNSFFEKFCADACVVSTYACTGALKRALKSQGFEVLLKPGFMGKRLRTMGVRNWQNLTRDQFLNL